MSLLVRDVRFATRTDRVSIVILDGRIASVGDEPVVDAAGPAEAAVTSPPRSLVVKAGRVMASSKGAGR